MAVKARALIYRRADGERWQYLVHPIFGVMDFVCSEWCILKNDELRHFIGRQALNATTKRYHQTQALMGATRLASGKYAAIISSSSVRV
jgi:hypothetical protein